MKNLKLTILQEPGFVAELMNVFGKGVIVRPLHGNSKFIQFDFPNINLFTSSKIEPIYRLLNSFEENHGTLKLKMFHLFDDKNKSYSQFSYMCIKGIWEKQERGAVIASSKNLLELI